MGLLTEHCQARERFVSQKVCTCTESENCARESAKRHPRCPMNVANSGDTFDFLAQYSKFYEAPRLRRSSRTQPRHPGLLGLVHTFSRFS